MIITSGTGCFTKRWNHRTHCKRVSQQRWCLGWSLCWSCCTSSWLHCSVWYWQYQILWRPIDRKQNFHYLWHLFTLYSWIWFFFYLYFFFLIYVCSGERSSCHVVMVSPPAAWEVNCSGCNWLTWTEQCESKFLNILSDARTSKGKPRSHSDWVSELRGQQTARILIKQNNSWSEAFMSKVVPFVK